MATTYNNLYLDTRARLKKAGVEAAQAAWEGRLRELQAWQGVSRQSDGGKGERP